MRAACISAALIALPAVAQAEASRPLSQVTPSGAVQLVIGDQITVRLPETGRPEMVSVRRAPTGAALPPRPGAGRFDDPPAGSVIISLERVGQDDVMMKVESGVSKAFDYRARLMHEISPGAWGDEPTSVCTVLPLLSAYEHWPKRDKAAGIILSGFTFRDTNEVVCPDPKTLPPEK